MKLVLVAVSGTVPPAAERIKAKREKTSRELVVFKIGAPGFEPGNAGIKIQWLTACRRPKSLRLTRGQKFLAHVTRSRKAIQQNLSDYPDSAYFL